MNCEVCGEGPENGTTVYRQNALGEVGRWRCRKHSQAAVEAEVARLVAVLDPKESGE